MEKKSPPNKIILTPEQEQFLLDNYGKMTKPALAQALRTNSSTILDMMDRRGLKRTPEQIEFIMKNSKNKPSAKTIEGVSAPRRRIEGGSRENMKARWHLAKWTEKNGTFDLDKILVYQKPGNKYEDLILIDKKNLDTFILERDTPKKDWKNVSRVSTKSKLTRHDEEKHEKNFEKIKADSLNKTVDQAVSELINEGKVPVRLDSKTLVWVKREKCVQLEDGSWVKKDPLNIQVMPNPLKQPNPKKADTDKDDIPGESPYEVIFTTK
jgi:hypothetical protein